MAAKILIAMLGCLPLHHFWLTSGFGNRLHPITGMYRFHAGVDLAAHQDTVFAVMDGNLREGYDPKLGLFIKLDREPFEIAYGHLSQLLATPGDIQAGEPIAITGATGAVTGEHLHFAVSYKGVSINPMRWLFLNCQCSY
jgi:murein DD-endopeptidase MepM/ murein hydrolase activator NlpD